MLITLVLSNQFWEYGTFQIFWKVLETLEFVLETLDFFWKISDIFYKVGKKQKQIWWAWWILWRWWEQKITGYSPARTANTLISQSWPRYCNCPMRPLHTSSLGICPRSLPSITFTVRLQDLVCLQRLVLLLPSWVGVLLGEGAVGVVGELGWAVGMVAKTMLRSAVVLQ